MAAVAAGSLGVRAAPLSGRPQRRAVVNPGRIALAAAGGDLEDASHGPRPEPVREIRGIGLEDQRNEMTFVHLRDRTREDLVDVVTAHMLRGVSHYCRVSRYETVWNRFDRTCQRAYSPR